jgi:NAD(P)H-hydrate repair Nnr-like enzyme with NAD(P)H-hydrate epimerase domain
MNNEDAAVVMDAVRGEGVKKERKGKLDSVVELLRLPVEQELPAASCHLGHESHRLGTEQYNNQMELYVYLIVHHPANLFKRRVSVHVNSCIGV